MNLAIAQSYDDLYQLKPGGAVFAGGWADGWIVPEPKPVQEWADTYRRLPRESSAEHGPWRTSRTPYLREPMAVLSDDHPCKRVVLVFGTQTGKTEAGNNWVGSIIHQVPGPMMVVQPSQTMGNRWTRQRFNPMVALTSVLSALIKPARGRDSGNTATMKEFPGGFLVIAWAHSASSLSSMPVRYLFMDEVDRYPDDVDGEGHPVDLADRRTATFPRRKVLLTSSPTVKDESAIEAEFELSDQRHYYVPCPHCNHMHILEDDNLTDEAEFLCPAGGHLVQEHHKTWMLENGEWRAHNPDSKIPGFHLPSYYSPIGLGYSWAEIVDLRQKAKDKPEKWKAYVNTIEAKTYEDESGRVDYRDIQARAGGYASRTIPQDCLLLSCGIDTQDDRVAIIVLGWGRNETCWVIDYVELPGDPSQREFWEGTVEPHIERTYTNAFGVEMRVLATGIDSGGHHTHDVYNFTRWRKNKLIFALKGSSQTHKPVIAGRPTMQDVNTDNGILKGGVELWSVGSDTARSTLYARLNADGAHASHEQHRVRFPNDLPESFYQQLTNARYDRDKERWKKPKTKRHEVGDCWIYAYAAAQHPLVRVHMLRERDWQKLEEKYQPAIQDLFAHAPSQEQPVEKNDRAAVTAEKLLNVLANKTQPDQQPQQSEPKPQPRRPAARRPVRKGGYVGAWK